jgi:hypothetical protein
VEVNQQDEAKKRDWQDLPGDMVAKLVAEPDLEPVWEGSERSPPGRRLEHAHSSGPPERFRKSIARWSGSPSVAPGAGRRVGSRVPDECWFRLLWPLAASCSGMALSC